MVEGTTITSSVGSNAGKATEANRGDSPSGTPSRVHPASAGTVPSARTPLNQVYALPLPIRTFPLPTFYPHNPVSLLHLAFAWLRQVLHPPPPEPSVIHAGIWDPETRSVHIKDPASIRALWEQGFYGKGSLSRSEPNWLKRELARRGSLNGTTVSEARTELRREERRLAKWERAKAELEAIERQRLAEAASNTHVAEASEPNGRLDEPAVGPTQSHIPANSEQVAVAGRVSADTLGKPPTKTAPHSGSAEYGTTIAVLRSTYEAVKAPIGPTELLALPNSTANLNRSSPNPPMQPKPPTGPSELLSLPNSHAELASKSRSLNGTVKPYAGALLAGSTTSQYATLGLVNGNGHAVEASALASNMQFVDELSTNGAQPNGVGKRAPSPVPSSRSSEFAASPQRETKDPLKRRKSVRFSPQVESTTFQHFDPPSPTRSPNVVSKRDVLEPPDPENKMEINVASTLPPATQPLSGSTSVSTADGPVCEPDIENKEHFQLSPEETFFLVFSLGALSVVDPVTGSPIPAEHLLRLLRSYSYFPPKSTALRPDDPFLVNYAVYHHFRSLGWVPRHGIKFGVDWILYQRGPVFDHSEFGIMVMPAFSDPAWEEHEHETPRRSWSWLMGVNRVLSHVLKSLVLVYVDIPSPETFDAAIRNGGIAAALQKYTIREVMVRRFSVNRNR